MKLEGIVAIVTGGGSGLGAATARQLARKGARVALFDLNAKGAEEVANDINGIGITCNVTDEQAVQSALEQTTSALGAPRILVNCAGIGGAHRVVGKNGPHPLDEFRKVVEVNLVGTFNMIRLFAAQAQDLDPLEGGERGVIVNTSSVAAFDGQIGQSAYAATKGGIASMTLPLARDLSRAGIRVMTIAPGIFKTPMLAGLSEEAQASLGMQVPFPPRLGEPEEYGDLVCHIVSNQMLNGEVIRLDGAIRMGPK